MTLVKLNRNYKGYGVFTHRVEFYGSRDHRVRQWIGVRNWLWQNFGPSAEQELARPEFFDGAQPKWAWDTEKSSVYLREEALMMFNLTKDRWNG